jgi:hypothetical protein
LQTPYVLRYNTTKARNAVQDTPPESNASSNSKWIRRILAKRFVFVVLGILFFGLSVALSASALLIMYPKEDSSVTKEPDQAAKKESKEEAAKKVDGAGLILKDVLAATKLRLFGQIAHNPTNSSPSVYRTVPGYDFQIPSNPKETWSATIYIPMNDYADKRAVLADYFTSRGYVVHSNEPRVGEHDTYDSTNYDSPADSCRVDKWLQYREKDSLIQSVVLTCAPFKNVTMDAAALRPFYAMIAADSTVDRASIKMQALDIKPAKTKGYNVYKGALLSRHASSGAETPFAVFYQTPQGIWKLTYKAPGGLICADVNDADMLKAFAGEYCFIDKNVNDTSTQNLSDIKL